MKFCAVLLICLFTSCCSDVIDQCVGRVSKSVVKRVNKQFNLQSGGVGLFYGGTKGFDFYFISEDFADIDQARIYAIEVADLIMEVVQQDSRYLEEVIEGDFTNEHLYVGIQFHSCKDLPTNSNMVDYVLFSHRSIVYFQKDRMVGRNNEIYRESHAEAYLKYQNQMN